MSFIAELKRRNVVRVAVAYLAAAWLLIQIADTVFPAYGLPQAALPVLITLLAIGLIPVVVISWAFELTPEGLRRETDSDMAATASPRDGKNFDRTIMIVLALAVGYFIFDELVIEQKPESDNSIAVLPFVSLNPDADEAFLSDGISAEILHLLGTIKELRVPSRSTTFRYRGAENIGEVAQELGVSYVLEGSVQKLGDRLRVTAQLIDAPADDQVWSRSWDADVSDIFAVQDEIARDVASELQVRLLSKRRPQQETDPETYALYLQAKHMMYGESPDTSNLDAMAGLLRTALQRDPDYVPAMLQLSLTLAYAVIAEPDRAAELDPENDRIVARAYELDPDDAIANLYKGWREHASRADLPGGMPYFQRAIELDPGNTEVMRVGSFIAHLIGRFGEAIILGERAVGGDLLCVPCYSPLQSAYLNTGQLEKAERLARQRVELVDDVGGNFHLARTLIFQGRSEEAFQYIDKIKDVEYDWLLLTALAQHEMGEADASARTAEKLVYRYGNAMPALVAGYFGFSGSSDTALEWVARQIAEEPGSFIYMIWDYELQSLRETEQWRQWREESGLDETTLADIDFSIPEFGP